MKGFFRTSVALTILAVCVSQAISAERMVPEEGAIEVMLLRQQSVQRELKLTPDEVEKVHKHCAQQWEKAQKVSALAEAERDKQFTELTRENHRFVEQTLTKEQARRLDQISLQVAGLLCVTRPEIAAKLKLTDEQKKKAHEMQKVARLEAEELIHSTKKEQKREKLRELRVTSQKRIADLLTDEQERTWKDLTGEHFAGDLAFFDPDV